MMLETLREESSRNSFTVLGIGGYTAVLEPQRFWPLRYVCENVRTTFSHQSDRLASESRPRNTDGKAAVHIRYRSSEIIIMSADADSLERRERIEQLQHEAAGMVAQLECAYDVIQNKLQPITALMYDRDRYSYVDKLLSAAEEKTNIKREKLVYGTVFALLFYVIIGALAQIISNIVGFIYPAWRSIKAVRSNTKDDDTQWLIYWIVFSTFSIVDFSVFSTVPFYWLFKISFLMYLYLPMFNGATVVYESIIDPVCSLIESYSHPSEPKKAQ
ncbi:hypothetical protein Q1695_014930 [Nippostrongylus brasiliensis]|nr:hypothetical protein Q1695_014930 [Nippostrongylus brasiliensis]